IRQAGEQAVFEANCGEFHEELVGILGRLKYRTSYGQNVLKHTLEVVHLSGIMASELQASVKIAKRSALLHDLGKALTHEVEGSHALISAQYARGESLESYIKRLESLEELAARKAGVDRVYALQAGREIRVIVRPAEIDDD